MLKEKEREENRLFFKKRQLDERMLRVFFGYFSVLFLTLFLNWALFLLLFYGFLLFTAVVVGAEWLEIRREKKAKDEVS